MIINLEDLPDHERTAFIERVKSMGAEAQQDEVVSVILFYMDRAKEKAAEKLSVRRSGSSVKRKDQIDIDF